jgi:peptidoglycan/xylan/chitin deacetylase (PgdA/CDA1 family)
MMPRRAVRQFFPARVLRWVLLGVVVVAAELAVTGRPWEAVLLAAAAHATFCATAAIPNHALTGPLVKRFRPAGRQVWLTIDDGPNPDSTPAILRVLREHGVRATFFLIGERAARHPELVRAIADGGHTFGNHTFHHASASFWTAAPWRIAREIDRATDAIAAAGGPAPRFFRPPVGMANLFVGPALQKRSLRRIGWSARGFDTRPQPRAIAVTRIMQTCAPGAIILLHELGPAAGAATLELLLARLRAESYECVLPADEALIPTGGAPA